MRYVCDADAERMTQALARLPDGTWQAKRWWTATVSTIVEEYPVRCCIRKRGARIEIDLSGTARQARTSINGTFLDVKATVGVALKFLLDPNGRFTSGMYRPVDIVIPPGAICSALPPQGVVFAYGESTNALLLAMLQAMADAVGEDAVAGDTGSPNLHTARGVNADGTPWIAVGVAGGESGPWGATSAGDADSYSKFYQANSIDTAVEVSETDSPVVVLRREYVADSAGRRLQPRWRGGAEGFDLPRPAAHNLIVLRFKRPTGKGVRGGGDGATGGVWLWHPSPGERWRACLAAPRHFARQSASPAGSTRRPARPAPTASITGSVATRSGPPRRVPSGGTSPTAAAAGAKRGSGNRRES